MYELRYKTHFDAAHFLPDYKGKCHNEHGHRFEVEIIIASDVLNDQHMVLDFAELKKHIDLLDHRLLNEVMTTPTAEALAKFIYEMVTETIGETLIYPRHSVEVWESPNASVKYYA